MLGDAVTTYPNAKRALLTDFKDRDAAIQAMKAAYTHVYLFKPCQPPDQNLYPTINDLLSDWEIEAFPPMQGLVVRTLPPTVAALLTG